MVHDHVNITEIVNVDEWYVEDDRPTGSRAKVTVVDPKTDKFYIFKTPKQRREDQLWSELLGSFIAGDLLNWNVQKTSIAMRDDRVGNLLGYIYAEDERMLEGWHLCREVDKEYDQKKGKRHTLQLIKSIYEEVAAPKWHVGSDDYHSYWAKAFSFDALISNSDRHAENWALVVGSDYQSCMSSLYDNGTSLGCQVDEVGLSKLFLNEELCPEKLSKFISAGRHHVRLAEPSSEGGCFGEICKEWLTYWPDSRTYYEQIADLDLRPISTLLNECAENEIFVRHCPLSHRRIDHMLELLRLGQERMRSVLRFGND